MTTPTSTPVRPANPHLESLLNKLQVLRDDVSGVALGYLTGCWVHGAGGLGKSHAVCDELRRRNVTPRVLTTLTARGLYDHLRSHPDDVTLLDDAEALFRDRNAVGLLRAALWASPLADGGGRVPARTVTWATHRHSDERIVFDGGIVILTNSPPPRTPEWDALTTRIPVTHLHVSDAELRAQMRHLAETVPPTILGYEMTADECLEVCEYLIGQANSRDCPLDLRLFVSACQRFVQFQQGDGGLHWHDRGRALVARSPQRLTRPADVSGTTGLERRERDRALVREILTRTSVRTEQVEIWTERTGKSPRTFDYLKAEVRGEDSE